MLKARSYDHNDNGTMPKSVAGVADLIVGHRIIAADPVGDYEGNVRLTLDDGTKVDILAFSDCCAYTEVRAFLLNPERVEHVITGVRTEDDYQSWHIYADLGDVMELTVGWSSGNPFYYAYGFDIQVVPATK
jgi:hypothetical protein